MNAKKSPYVPLGWEVFCVPEENKFMQAAKNAAHIFSTDSGHPTGSVVVKDGIIVGRGGNRSLFHKYFGCVRKGLRKIVSIPSGKRYWTCYGCSPKFHAEQSAIRDAKKKGHSLGGADLYLWGHWWCCESCWEKIINAKIERVFLVEGAEKKF